MTAKEQQELAYTISQFLPLHQRLSRRRQLANIARAMAKADKFTKYVLWNKFKEL